MSDPDIYRRLRELEAAVANLKGHEHAQVGSLVPTLAGSGTAGAFTYDTASTFFRWTRHGNLIFFRGRVRITAIITPATGDVSINTLPTAALTTTFGFNGGATMHVWLGLNIVAGFTQVEGQIVDGATNILLVASGDNVTAARVQGGELSVAVSGAIDLRFTGFYEV